MNVILLSFSLFVSLLSNVSLAANCENFKGYELKEKLCWDQSIRGWITARCLDKNQKCQAKDFFSSKLEAISLPEMKGGQNPAAMICHHLKLEVLILKDPQNNEQSFCRFKDKSLVDANSVERNVK